MSDISLPSIELQPRWETKGPLFRNVNAFRFVHINISAELAASILRVTLLKTEISVFTAARY